MTKHPTTAVLNNNGGCGNALRLRLYVLACIPLFALHVAHVYATTGKHLNTLADAPDSVHSGRVPTRRQGPLPPLRGRGEQRSLLDFGVQNSHPPWIATESPRKPRLVSTDMQRYLNKFQTTWTCSGEGRARACLFHNIWWEKNTRRFWVHGGDEPPPSLFTTNKWGNPTSFGWLSSSDFKMQSEGFHVRHRVGDHLFVDQTWTWNVAHGLWDGLFSSWTAMLNVFDGKPPEKFRVVVHAYDMTSESFNRSLFRQAVQEFGGNGLIAYLDDKSLNAHSRTDAGWECFKRIVIGAGAKGLRWYHKDMRMAGTKYMRAFRDRMLIMNGIKPSSPQHQGLVSIFENKRFNEPSVMHEIQQAITKLKDEGLNVAYVKWNRIAQRYNQMDNFSPWQAQLAAVSQTSVYVSAPGTGMLMAPFLPDGAVVIDLLGVSATNVTLMGDDGFPQRSAGIRMPNPEDDNLLGAISYVRSMYYPSHLRIATPGIQHRVLENLIKDALDLIEKEISVDDDVATLSLEATAVSRACAALPTECIKVLDEMNSVGSGCSAKRTLTNYNTAITYDFDYMHREFAQSELSHMSWPATILYSSYIFEHLGLREEKCIPSTFAQIALAEARKFGDLAKSFDAIKFQLQILFDDSIMKTPRRFQAKTSLKLFTRELDPAVKDLARAFVVPGGLVDNGIMDPAVPFEVRHNAVMSDPSNLFIARCNLAGYIIQTSTGKEYTIMHNGIAVDKLNSYYGSYSDVFSTNKGVHEAAEERMFGLVLSQLPRGSTMLELGSYWSYYSIWFQRAIPESKAWAIEGEKENLEVGRENARINGAKIDFTQGFVGGSHGINVADFLEERKISWLDVLHIDVQGSEAAVMQDMDEWFATKRVRYVFVSTHGRELNDIVYLALSSNGYRIIANVVAHVESFMLDGLVLGAHPDETAIPEIDLGSYRYTAIRNVPFEGIYSGEECEYLPKGNFEISQLARNLSVAKRDRPSWPA